MTWIEPLPRVELTGEETFAGLNATVLDFWAFATSDLRTNNVRGYLAEFLVARAVGATHPRVEWDAFDVRSPDGSTIEVKSSAYLQVWKQRRLSAPRFSGLRSRAWTPEDGYEPEPSLHADVYVFCLNTAKTHRELQPLDTSQWEFYVLARAQVEAVGTNTFSLSAIQKMTEPVLYDGLGDRIRAVHQDGGARSSVTS
jgi:hypothetical protein